MKSSDKLKSAKSMLVEAMALIFSAAKLTDTACVDHQEFLGGEIKDIPPCMLSKFAEDLKGILCIYDDLISGAERSDN